MPGEPRRQINDLRVLSEVSCTDSVRLATLVRYTSAINMMDEVPHEFPEFQ